MNFDLGAVLSALITAGLAAMVALATSLSPSSVRVKRLERLVDARERVDSPVARQRLDYAIESLTYQIAEDVKHLGNRNRRQVIAAGIMLMFVGAAWAFYQASQGDGQLSWSAWVGFVGYFIGGSAVLWGMTSLSQSTLDTVKKELTKRSHDQRGESASAVGSPEGDVPAS